jgi:hypothetical protein
MRPTPKLPVRFPLTMLVRYQTKSAPALVSGTSVTKWIGSRQIAFAANDDIREKMKVQLAISWPCLLENRVRLQLIVDAIVTNVADGVAEAAIVQHDFRTRRDQQPAAAGDTVHVGRQAVLPSPAESAAQASSL